MKVSKFNSRLGQTETFPLLTIREGQLKSKRKKTSENKYYTNDESRRIFPVERGGGGGGGDGYRISTP